ncbi:DoxX family protein [Azospirillum griseum]|uniref:DoxX family protein n=1 Tax=Azospirillum griseum TaxID=2496639 RepID=A0A3S0K3L0_9PROT|nr:DoxX family protein [Azospirillum griseum]RTR18312.1 DoxX family protein [Azospirillum griseum]
MTTATVAPRRNILGPGLWTVQGLLSLFFVYAGYTKLALPADQLAAMIPWTAQHPGLVPLTGTADLLGGLGILLPSLTRIQPRLTVLAALGIIILQVLALAFHLSRGEAAVVPMNVVLIALTAFVLWGRGRALPVQPR